MLRLGSDGKSLRSRTLRTQRRRTQSEKSLQVPDARHAASRQAWSNPWRRPERFANSAVSPAKASPSSAIASIVPGTKRLLSVAARVTTSLGGSGAGAGVGVGVPSGIASSPGGVGIVVEPPLDGALVPPDPPPPRPKSGIVP